MAGLAYKGVEGILIAPSKDVPPAGGAPQVSFVKGKVVYPCLTHILSLDEDMDDLEAGLEAGLLGPDLWLPLLVGLVQGFPEVSDETLGMKAELAEGALHPASEIRVLHGLAWTGACSRSLSLNQVNFVRLTPFRLLVQEMGVILQQDVHPFCRHMQDVSGILIDAPLQVKDLAKEAASNWKVGRLALESISWLSKSNGRTC